MKYILLNTLANMKTKVTQISTTVDTSSVTDLFKNWGNAFKEIFQSGSQVVAGVVAVVLVGFLIYQIVRLVQLKKHGQGDEIPSNVVYCLINLAIIAILGSYGITGWGLIK